MNGSPLQVKPAVSAEDLFSRHDADFVACAYITLLRRPVDPEGFLHYLLQLRSNGDKFAVVRALRASEEGRRHKSGLPGLLIALARYRLTRLRRFRIASVRCSEPQDDAAQTIKSASDTAAPWRDGLDPAWYLKTYPTLASTGLGPWEHYDTFGRAQGLLPNAAAARRLLINSEAYLAAYPDVAQTGMDAWEHYTLIGRAEGRVVGVSLKVLQFDGKWYLLRNPDAAAIPGDPFQHFTVNGILHGRNGSSFRGLQHIEPEPLVYTDRMATPELRVIAFYLPQATPDSPAPSSKEPDFPNSARASSGRPYHAEHEQPRLSGDHVYHAHGHAQMIERKIELARNHGINGFCFFLRRNRGNRLLDDSIEHFLAEGGLGFYYCFCWANDNYGGDCGGLKQQVKVGQTQDLECETEFIRDVARSFTDPRYIRVEGKPLFVIHRPEQLAEEGMTVALWRDWCRTNNIGEIHLCSLRTSSNATLCDTGTDASIEFPPTAIACREITPAVPDKDTAFLGTINSYLAATKAADDYVRPATLEYRGVMPGWDNTPMKMERGVSFYGATPELYSEWLNHALEETRRNLPVDHRLVFVNAWNNWAEGAFLEPDGRHGYAYLNRTREVLATYAPPVVNDADLRAKTSRTGRLAAIVHLYYEDLFQIIAAALDNVPESLDLYFSVRDGSYERVKRIIKARYPEATVVSYPNRGRDVLPLLHILGHIRGFGYEAICKIHSKKSRQRVDGERWRDDVLTKLLGSRARVDDILKKLQAGVGLVAPAGHLLGGATYCGSNAGRITQLAVRLGCPAAWLSDFSFPAGTMFWCRTDALMPLLDLGLVPDEFEPEAGQIDGTTAHAMERLIGLSVRKSGLTIDSTADLLANKDTPYPFVNLPSERA